MKKYPTISEKALSSINAVSNSLKPIYQQYKEQIVGLSKEEGNLIALEYIEELHAKLCMARVEEGIRKNKENKEIKSKLK